MQLIFLAILLVAGFESMLDENCSCVVLRFRAAVVRQRHSDDELLRALIKCVKPGMTVRQVEAILGRPDSHFVLGPVGSYMIYDSYHIKVTLRFCEVAEICREQGPAVIAKTR
jgi:hypothetical protein